MKEYARRFDVHLDKIVEPRNLALHRAETRARVARRNSAAARRINSFCDDPLRKLPEIVRWLCELA